MENLQNELAKNCTLNQSQLTELMKEYELAKLGYEVQRQHFKDIHNHVLEENEFFSSMDCHDIKKGERITNETFDFLLSKDDFNRYMDLAKPYYVAEGLTDENGYYIKNWLSIEVDSKQKLVNFIIDIIIPAPMRKGFEYARKSVVYQDKLIGIVKSAFVN